MRDWLQAIADIEALEGVALDAELIERMGASSDRPPGRIDFYTPTFKHYESAEIAACGKSLWPAVSITGGACQLACDHCKAKILEPMIPARTPDELWRVAISVGESLPEELVDDAVTSYLDAVLPEGFPHEVVARTKYRMHQRCATSLRRGRVVIAGDAAHATNPTSGYGLVGGLHDANILSEALAAVVHGDAPADILDQYSKDRIEAFLEVSSPISVARCPNSPSTIGLSG